MMHARKYTSLYVNFDTKNRLIKTAKKYCYSSRGRGGKTINDFIELMLDRIKAESIVKKRKGGAQTRRGDCEKC